MDRKIKRILVTCTESKVPNTLQGVAMQDRKHGLMSIGCHYLITRNGEICVGRNEEQNCIFDPTLDSTSINIRLVGLGYDFTSAQTTSLFALEERLTEKYPDAEICEYLPQHPKAKK
ncbi:TPA: N-acetylmuramoyl-L-alanine amidase [Photobacterium damselae]